MKEEGGGNCNISVLHRKEVAGEDDHWQYRRGQGNLDEVRKKKGKRRKRKEIGKKK